MKKILKTNGMVKKCVSMLFSGILLVSQFSVSSVHAADAQVVNTYDSIVSKAGNYAMKQLGESIRSNASNAQVVTTDPGTGGTIYYVAPDGSDSNNGTSPTTPWKTVQKVNAKTYSPGDKILFKAGGSWELTEALHPLGSGVEGNRIVIGAYGSGAKPKLSAKNIAVPWTFTDGSTRYASDALYLENQQYVEIRDLDISNKPDGYTGQESSTQAAMRKDRRGIHIVGGNNTTQTELKGFWLHDLYVHDVVGEANGVSGSGWDPSKRTAGILFEIIVKGTDGLPVIANPVDVTGYQPTWFSEVTIEKNVLIDNSFGSIIVKQLQAWGARQDASAPSYDYTGWYPNKNFTIQDNYLDHDGSEYAADTIYLTCANNSIIRHNVSRGAGTSGIELYFTDGITVEWNEVFRARQKPTGADSNAIDTDKATTNALVQYNYIHENGDGILLCGFIYGSSVYRYNVIKDSDSAKRYLNIHGDKGYNYIYNNIFYHSGTTQPTFVASSGGSGYLNDSNNFHYLYNNIFYSPNNASARLDDGTGLTYSNNSYYNVSAIPVEDTAALVGDPKFIAPSSITGGIGNDVDLTGLKLQANSPLIDNGKNITSHANTTIPVGTITDYAGSPISSGGTDIGIYEYADTVRYQGETTSVTTSGVGTSTASESSASGGSYFQTDSSTSTGNWVEFNINVPASGTYSVNFGYKKNTARGTTQLKIDGINQGGTVDQYAGTPSYTSSNLGNVVLAAGTHKFRFTVTGKNASSSSYAFTVDYVELSPQSVSTLPTRYQGETTSVTTGGVSTSTASDTSASGSSYFQTVSPTNTGDWMEFTVSVPATGTYNIDFGYKKNTGRGTVQLKVDGVNQGGVVDQYSGVAAFSAADLGNVNLSAGSHKLRFSVTGKNASSSSYAFTVDYMDLTPLPLSSNP